MKTNFKMPDIKMPENLRMSDTAQKYGGALGKGLIGGLAGTAAMTAAKYVEKKITGHREMDNINKPADAASKALNIDPGQDKQARSNQIHWTYGTLWGIARGLLAMAGLRKWSGTAAHFAAVAGTAVVMERALKVAPPPQKYNRKELMSDLLEHAVYAIAAGLVVDALIKDRD